MRKGGKGDAEGRGIYREREEKGHFGEEKGMFRGRERGVSGRKIAEGIGIGVSSTLAVSNIRNRTYTNYEVYLIGYGYGKFKEKIHFME